MIPTFPMLVTILLTDLRKAAARAVALQARGARHLGPSTVQPRAVPLHLRSEILLSNPWRVQVDRVDWVAQPQLLVLHAAQWRHGTSIQDAWVSPPARLLQAQLLVNREAQLLTMFPEAFPPNLFIADTHNYFLGRLSI